MKKRSVIPVGGFLDAGKTHFIEQMRKPEDAVLSMELGDETAEDAVFCERCTLETLDAVGKSGDIYLELNGAQTHEAIFALFDAKAFRARYRVDKSYFLIDPANFSAMRANFPEIYGREIFYYTDILVRQGPKRDACLRDLKSLGIEADLYAEDDEGYLRDGKRDAYAMIAALLFVCAVGLFLTVSTNAALFRVLRLTLTNFTAFFLEALPFFAAGALISSAIRHLSSRAVRWIRPHRIGMINILKGMSTGLFMPICDCAGVPVGLGFLRRGADEFFTLAFTLSTPILNPIVFFSTYAAFGNWRSVALRAIGGALTVLLAVFLWKVTGGTLVRPGADVGDCNCRVAVDTSSAGWAQKVRSILLLASEEFMRNIGILMLGILLSSLAKGILPQSAVDGKGAVALAVVLAFCFSLCSSSDAFIARAMFTTTAPMMAFMLAGPMMDLKNTLVFMRSQGRKRAMRIAFCVMLSALIVSYGMGWLMPGGMI